MLTKEQIKAGQQKLVEKLNFKTDTIIVADGELYVKDDLIKEIYPQTKKRLWLDCHKALKGKGILREHADKVLKIKRHYYLHITFDEWYYLRWGDYRCPIAHVEYVGGDFD